ncbi:MAG: hypothetical protein JRI46_11665 [Deltaproteobacteria bacterium]|nr:hypothetical protein [Deltaproteobacteria bacterium]
MGWFGKPPKKLSYGLSVFVSDIPPNREVELVDDRYFPAGDEGELSSKPTRISA